MKSKVLHGVCVYIVVARCTHSSALQTKHVGEHSSSEGVDPGQHSAMTWIIGGGRATGLQPFS